MHKHLLKKAKEYVKDQYEQAQAQAQAQAHEIPAPCGGKLDPSMQIMNMVSKVTSKITQGGSSSEQASALDSGAQFTPQQMYEQQFANMQQYLQPVFNPYPYQQSELYTAAVSQFPLGAMEASDTGFFNQQPSAPTVAQNAQVPFGAPPPPPGPQTISSSSAAQQDQEVLYPKQLLALIPNRTYSAQASLGRKACLEARKGLSRELDARSAQDIELFGDQLRRSDRSAIEPDWRTEDRLPIFAVTYVQSNPPIGRFKFDRDQWSTLQYVVRELSRCGLTKFRLWLDQCLWLRDASQQAWAHTGLLPYAMWPVICLGRKQAGSQKSIESKTRMWPFVEEVAGLWGMGVVYGREMRGRDEKAGWRWWVDSCLRTRLEPEDVMTVLLLNIFHGAVDALQTGWKEDVEELRDMSIANIRCSGELLFVGSDWRERIAREGQHNLSGMLQYMVLPAESFTSDTNIYLDASRVVVVEHWDGWNEWLSGVSAAGITPDPTWIGIIYMSVKKLNVMTNIGEFQILTYSNGAALIRLLVAMDGPSSNFSRGKVAWTKIMTGIGSCQVESQNLGSLGEIKLSTLGQILSVELQRKVDVIYANKIDADIQWV